MTVSLLRSISCIVNNNKKSKEIIRENQHESKDKLWKTFSEAVEDEQEFLRKYFASQEQIKLTSVSNMESVPKEETEKVKKKAVMSRSDSLNIILPMSMLFFALNSSSSVNFLKFTCSSP